MKKLFILSLALSVFSTTFFTSCSESAEQVAINDMLLTDQAFTDAVLSTVDLFMTAQDNDWQSESQVIAALMRKAGSDGLSADEEAQLEDLLGMTREAYIQYLSDYGNTMNALLEKYPVLQDMNAAERQELFTDVISRHDELAAYMAEIQSALRACPLQDICNLVVDLAVIIGGPFLCDIIAGAIPIIGPLLCNIVLDLASDILTGLCDALPC
jgi:hypothetical protein